MGPGSLGREGERGGRHMEGYMESGIYTLEFRSFNIAVSSFSRIEYPWLTDVHTSERMREEAIKDIHGDFLIR